MKLSIITVNLNNVQGLQKTIDSVIAQTFRDYEWIVIDGGSTDRSIDTIRKYSGKITTWISEPDKGVYPAMNKGIVMAKGEYCFFLNSGDHFLNENSLSDFFSAGFSEDVVSGNMYAGIEGKVREKCRGKHDLTFLDIYLSHVKHQSTFIRRELFDRFGLYDEKLKIVADYEFFLKTVGLGGASYRYIDSDLTWFDDGGLSNRNPSLVAEEKKLVAASNIPLRMIADLDLLVRYRNIRFIDRFGFTRMLQRILGKLAKTISKG